MDSINLNEFNVFNIAVDSPCSSGHQHRDCGRLIMSTKNLGNLTEFLSGLESPNSTVFCERCEDGMYDNEHTKDGTSQ